MVQQNRSRERSEAGGRSDVAGGATVGGQHECSRKSFPVPRCTGSSAQEEPKRHALVRKHKDRGRAVPIANATGGRGAWNNFSRSQKKQRFSKIFF